MGVSFGGGLEGAAARLEWESNAPEVLLCKTSGERSENFCAAVRRKSNGIFMDRLTLPGGPGPELPEGHRRGGGHIQGVHLVEDRKSVV